MISDLIYAYLGQVFDHIEKKEVSILKSLWCDCTIVMGNEQSE